MNLQHLVVPATIAAGLHVALLFGLPNPPPIVITKHKVVVDKGPEQPPMELVEPPPPPAEDDILREVKPLPQGTARPEGEETYHDIPKTAFVIEPMPSNPRHVVDTGKIGLPGVPEGIGPSLGDIGTRGATWAQHLDKQPRATVRMSPTYPSALRSDGIEGVVMVEFDVDVKGRVVSARVRESTDRAFDEPTIRAVLQWRFEPGLSQGRPVPFRMVIPVNFTLGTG